MKNNILTFLFVLIGCNLALKAADVTINETNFPDANFRSFLTSQTYGTDGVLTSSEISSINRIDVGGRAIQDLTGIEYFTELTVLNCYKNKLRRLDLSQNNKLGILNCYTNQLSSLRVSPNAPLAQVKCYENCLTGQELDYFIISLPTRTSFANFTFMYDSYQEGNYATTSQVAAMKAKKWNPQQYIANVISNYDGGDEITNYDLWVGGVQVNSANKDHLGNLAQNSGTITYDPINKDLKLNGASITVSNDIAIKNRIGNLELIIEGNNTITSGFKGIDSQGYVMSILGTGTEPTLQLTAAGIGIYTNMEFRVINGVNLTVDGGSAGIMGQYDSSSGTYSGTLRVGSDATELHVKGGYDTNAPSDRGSICQLKQLDLDNNLAYGDLRIVSPANCSFAHSIYLNGQVVKDWVDIVCAFEITPTTVPDEGLRSAFLWQSWGQDGLLTYRENLATTRFGSNGSRISDLTGLTCLRHLTNLTLNNNGLTTLGNYLVINPDLETLDCAKNELTSIMFASNSKISTLFCNNNKLTSLDLSHCPRLNSLRCYGNNISGEEMENMIMGLPYKANSQNAFYLYDETNENEGNHITKTYVRFAKKLGWVPYYHDNISSPWKAYDGEDEAPATSSGDVNGDGQITISDVTKLVNIVLGKEQ